MAEGVYKVTEWFEEAVCKYTGAPYCVALDNCSNALFLALFRHGVTGIEVELPSHTYPSVPCAIRHAGGIPKFIPSKPLLKGSYQLSPTPIYDSALSFTYGMYLAKTTMCLSFTGPFKHLKLGKGGAIITDNEEDWLWFKRARFSGRREKSYHEDTFDMMGWNFYMAPEIAARGLLLMEQFYLYGEPQHKEDLELKYPDLSKAEAYK